MVTLTEDIDECIEDPFLCKNGGDCQNIDGGYVCECDELFCGQHCTLDNPCINVSIKSLHPYLILSQIFKCP